MCSDLMLEIKSFVSFKNKSYLFWTRVHFRGEGAGAGEGEFSFPNFLGAGCS